MDIELNAGEVWEWKLYPYTDPHTVILVEPVIPQPHEDVSTWRAYHMADHDIDDWNFCPTNMDSWRRIA